MPLAHQARRKWQTTEDPEYEIKIQEALMVSTLGDIVGKSSRCHDLREFPGMFWNISSAYKFVICYVYSLVCNGIHYIPSQTNVRLGFCDRYLGSGNCSCVYYSIPYRMYLYS